MPIEPALRITDLVKTYGAGEARVCAVDHVSLDIDAARLTAIVGSSGSGKSTLMHCAAGLDRFDSGHVVITGLDIAASSDDEVTRLRREHIGFVFQSFNLMPMLDARDNILLPLQLAGRRVDTSWFETVVGMLEIGDRLSHRPSEMSGGQQQRVAIARALVSRPTVVFADEPTGALDQETSRAVMVFLRRSADELGQSIAMVTHEPAATAWAHRVVELTDGRITTDRQVA